MQPADCDEYKEKYLRGRRGAPAKGVGRLYRRESSNLSFSAKKSRSSERDFFIQADRLGISSPHDSAVHIISPFGAVYHHALGVYPLSA